MSNAGSILESTGAGTVDGDQVTLTYSHRYKGLLADVDSLVLSNPSGDYGVRTADGALVVAAATELVRSSQGVYSYTFTAPSPGLSYVWGVQYVRGDTDPSPYYEEYQFTDPTPAQATTLQAEKWFVVDAPDEWPVSEKEAGEHLRAAADVGSFCPYIAAATEYAEDRLSAALMPRIIRATFYDGEPLYLPRGPLLEVQSITDRNGTAISGYEIRHDGHRVQIVLTAGGIYPIAITYRAGYPSAAAIPRAIRLAILMHVATLWENRESITDKSKTIIPHSLEDFYRLKRRAVGVS